MNCCSTNDPKSMKLLALLSLLMTTPSYSYTNDCIQSVGYETNQIKRVRLDFTSPLGYTRHLLLGFTPDNAASDSFDYGYDA